MQSLHFKLLYMIRSALLDRMKIIFCLHQFFPVQKFLLYISVETKRWKHLVLYEYPYATGAVHALNSSRWITYQKLFGAIRSTSVNCRRHSTTALPPTQVVEQTEVELLSFILLKPTVIPSCPNYFSALEPPLIHHISTQLFFIYSKQPSPEFLTPNFLPSLLPFPQHILPSSLLRFPFLNRFCLPSVSLSLPSPESWI